MELMDYCQHYVPMNVMTNNIIRYVTTTRSTMKSGISEADCMYAVLVFDSKMITRQSIQLREYFITKLGNLDIPSQLRPVETTQSGTNASLRSSRTPANANTRRIRLTVDFYLTYRCTRIDYRTDRIKRPAVSSPQERSVGDKGRSNAERGMRPGGGLGQGVGAIVIIRGTGFCHQEGYGPTRVHFSQ